VVMGASSAKFGDVRVYDAGKRAASWGHSTDA
jgi:hypothetical protein